MTLEQRVKTKILHHHSQVTLLGNLVAKPEIRYKVNPVLPIAEFVVATHSQWFNRASNSFKDWTTFHPIRVEGEVVEQGLAFAEKGQLVYLQGCLITKQKSKKEVVYADKLQLFAKGGKQGINSVFCTGVVNSSVQQLTTENNKQMMQFSIAIHQRLFSLTQGKFIEQSINRIVHVWGESAKTVAEGLLIGDDVVIEGSLTYQNDDVKSQIIETKKMIKPAIS
jgi:single-stranded DNA-binding protein